MTTCRVAAETYVPREVTSMAWYWWLLIGVGYVVGFICWALCAVGSRSDAHIEKRKEQKDNV